MSQSPWGANETQFFFDLTPERILEAVEASGLRCTGRVLTLNSLENRVYEVELEVEGVKKPSDKFRIAKFYRPGRWSEAQILEEHCFLAELVEHEIPVIAPVPFPDGKTLHKMKDIPILYTVFPKMGGRNPDELIGDALIQVGRLMGRLHNIGASKKASSRIHLTAEVYGRNNLKYLQQSNSLPADVESRYSSVVEEICDISENLMKDVEVQRIHGDCHLGNVLWGAEGPFLVDFDDMVVGPCVQDMWLMIPGRDEEAKQKFDLMLRGYEEWREFDDSTRRLIEPLRALRFIHFSSWIACRWNDPFFQRTFINFGTPRYWQDQLKDLEDQLALCKLLPSI